MRSLPILILVGCLTLAQHNSLVAEASPETAPVVPATNSDPCVSTGQACDCENGPLPQRGLPVWYWFHAYRGRQQHYPPASPIPGNYYFKPYSLVQLRAQQEMIRKLGGDPRNLTGPMPKPANQIVKWPPALLDRRFSEHREVIETPYLRNPGQFTEPTGEDYQNMIGAVGRMRALLGQLEPEMPRSDIALAEKFLDRLADQARSHKLMIAEEASQAIARGELRSRPIDANRSPVTPASVRVPVAANRTVPANFELTSVQWPSVLQRPQFATQRAMLETPLQRSGAHPSLDEYRHMIEAAAQLKAMLEQPGQGITPQECIDGQRFLGRLAAEVRSQCVMHWHEQPDPLPSSDGLAQPSVEANPYANGGVYQQTTLQDAIADPVAPMQQVPFGAANPIRWPAALLDVRFEAQRTAVEGPFQNIASQPGCISPADYQAMTQAAEQMLKMLVSSQSAIDASQRLEAEKFLVRLIKEARDRAQAKADSPSADTTPGVIAWPPALRGPRFAAHRARIESPFRQENSSRSAEDYQAIILAGAEMKTMLDESKAELAEKAYRAAASFLEQLAAEARERLDAKLTPQEPTSGLEQPQPADMEASQGDWNLSASGPMAEHR